MIVCLSSPKKKINFSFFLIEFLFEKFSETFLKKKMSSEKQQQQDIINNKGNDEEAYLEEIERKIMARAEEEEKNNESHSTASRRPGLTFKQPETLILEPPKMSDQKVKKKKNTKKNICYFSSPLTKKKHTKIHRT